MKEKIYTIPVNDAFSHPDGCPLCSLEQSLNAQLLDYYLGPSLMEPDVRQTTNAKGFCREHLNQLYNREINRLGLGLMLHTHMADLVERLEPELKGSIPVARTGLFNGRKKDYREMLNLAAEQIEKRISSCVICDRMEATMERYLDVIFYEYCADPAFKNRFENVGGFCLPHLALLLRGAARYLNQNQASVFVAALTEIQGRSLRELRDDVEWFTLKFDYRNHDKSWKNSKDALPRSIRGLRGGQKPD
mgnify:FL=1